MHMTTANSLKTVLLLGLPSGLLLFGGQMLGGRQGLYIGLGLAVLMNFSGYFWSDKIALSMYSAQPVSETENPEAYRRVGAAGIESVHPHGTADAEALADSRYVAQCLCDRP